MPGSQRGARQWPGRRSCACGRCWHLCDGGKPKVVVTTAVTPLPARWSAYLGDRLSGVPRTGHLNRQAADEIARSFTRRRHGSMAGRGRGGLSSAHLRLMLASARQLQDRAMIPKAAQASSRRRPAYGHWPHISHWSPQTRGRRSPLQKLLRANIKELGRRATS